MLMVPLFHVHPEADHHHGEAGHVHGGTVHMVFSPDLDGEFDNQHSVDGFGHSNSSHADLFDHPLPVLEYAEFAFSFLGDSTDRKLLKPVPVHTARVEPDTLAHAAPVLSRIPHSAVTPPSIFLTRDIASRAPPSPLV